MTVVGFDTREANATMIVGILFVVTIFEIKIPRFVASGLLFFCVIAIVPFSLSSILVLLDYCDAGRAVCIFGFIAFALFLTITAWKWSERES